MTVQEFENKQQEYNLISGARYRIERLARAVENFKQDNPNTDYDASRLEELFLTLVRYEQFDICEFKNGVCHMADIVLDYEKKKCEELVANFEK